MAVKFDLFQNCQEGNNSTGLYTDGASPTVPATTLGGGVNLHGADVFHVHMIHDGTTPTMTIADTITNATFTTSCTTNILLPSVAIRLSCASLPGLVDRPLLSQAKSITSVIRQR